MTDARQTVYLAWTGSYSDRGLHGIYTSREDAEHHLLLLGQEGYYSYPEIEEWPLDTSAPRQAWVIYVSAKVPVSGEIQWGEPRAEQEIVAVPVGVPIEVGVTERVPVHAGWHVWASGPDEGHARKAIADTVARLRAERAGVA